MTLPLRSALLYAFIIAACAPLLAYYAVPKTSRWQLAVRVVAFSGVTAVLISGGVVPTRSIEVVRPVELHIGLILVEILWWLSAAWLGTSVLRAVLVVGSPRDSKLLHDLLGALIYCIALFSILGHVLDLPIKGLLATSGALAIIIGLALQNSLGDVFSGIVLNIEKPYRSGDWIILDDSLQGEVIETNWRATHILTGANDVAIVPNSVIAKAKLVNCSSPSKLHGTSLKVRIGGTNVSAARHVLEDIVLCAAHILRAPPPAVSVKDVGANYIEFEVGFQVATVGDAGLAQDDLYDRLSRGLAAAGLHFASRDLAMGGMRRLLPIEANPCLRLLQMTPLFASLSGEELRSIAAQMQRQVYESDAVILEPQQSFQAMAFIQTGVASYLTRSDASGWIEIGRLGPGDYFGEFALLTGHATDGRLVALTRVATYLIGKDVLQPLLQRRPTMAEDFSLSLLQRKSTLAALLRHADPIPAASERGMPQLAKAIRRMFLLGD